MRNFIFVILLFSCTSDEKRITDKMVNNSTFVGFYDLVDLKKARSEYLSPTRVSINDGIPIEIPMDSLIKKMGKPDNVIDGLDLIDSPVILEHNEDSPVITYWIYGDLSFEVSGQYAHFKSMRFSEKEGNITIDGKKIDYTTKAMDIQKMFPETGRMLMGHYNHPLLIVPVRAPIANPAFWMFSFGNGGKLLQLSFRC